MSKELKIKIFCNDIGKQVIYKPDIFSLNNYDELKKNTLEKLKNKNSNTNKNTNKKYIFEILECNIGIDSFWDSDTFNYFISKLKENLPEKIKLNLKKVDKYPKWERPQYLEIFKNSLNSAWNSTKKEIEEDLTEKYLDDGKRHYLLEKQGNEPDLKEELFSNIHTNIVCNNCLSSNFKGARYICSECNNFNLCEYCLKKACAFHKPEHTFIKLNNPIFEDIQKYNSIFSPNKKLITQKEEQPFEIKIDIINNGEKNLKGCFISPIRFGKNYLGCLKTTILDDCKKGDKITLNVLIKFEDEEDEEELLDSYEGFFRLMTKDGIPFGDIYNIKVLIEE